MRIISGCGNRRNRRISEFCYLHASDTCISFTLAGKVAKSAKVIRFRNFWEPHIPKNAYMLILWQSSRIRDLHARMTCAHNCCFFPISNCSLRLETCKQKYTHVIQASESFVRGHCQSIRRMRLYSASVWNSIF